MSLLQLKRERDFKFLRDAPRANARPRNVHERVENCNYALEIAQAQGMKVVGIGGKDIADGSTKLTLAILWQLMRADVMKFLSSMGMTERDIVRWANQRVGSIGSKMSFSAIRLVR